MSSLRPGTCNNTVPNVEIVQRSSEFVFQFNTSLCAVDVTAVIELKT
jgi:hypothetical protein